LYLTVHNRGSSRKKIARRGQAEYTRGIRQGWKRFPAVENGDTRIEKKVEE